MIKHHKKKQKKNWNWGYTLFSDNTLGLRLPAIPLLNPAHWDIPESLIRARDGSRCKASDQPIQFGSWKLISDIPYLFIYLQYPHLEKERDREVQRDIRLLYGFAFCKAVSSTPPRRFTVASRHHCSLEASHSKVWFPHVNHANSGSWWLFHCYSQSWLSITMCNIL